MSDPAPTAAGEGPAALPLVAAELFRAGMARLAGAVNIVTTAGPGGRAGFTASAVCSVTDSPPTLLVCLNAGSSAAPAFRVNEVLCVNTVGPGHHELAMRFGGKTPMEERFAGSDWTTGPGGAPVLAGSAVSFDCRIGPRRQVGSHEVIFCEVLDVIVRPEVVASVWYDRRFHALEG